MVNIAGKMLARLIDVSEIKGQDVTGTLLRLTKPSSCIAVVSSYIILQKQSYSLAMIEHACTAASKDAILQVECDATLSPL